MENYGVFSVTYDRTKTTFQKEKAMNLIRSTQDNLQAFCMQSQCTPTDKETATQKQKQLNFDYGGRQLARFGQVKTYVYRAFVWPAKRSNGQYVPNVTEKDIKRLSKCLDDWALGYLKLK